VYKFSKVYLDYELLNSYISTLQTKLDFTEADLSEQLSAELAELSNFRYCELFGSGTSALLAACIVSKKFVDTEQTVQVPSFSFPGLYSGLHYAGYKTELVDVDPETGLADTTGELTVHQSIADSKPKIGNNFSIEDNAWCLQSNYTVKPTFSMMSMGNNKLFSCGAGGALFFDDAQFIPLLKKLKFYGATGRASQGATRNGPGLNLKFDDWRAALILAQLKNYSQQIADINCSKEVLKSHAKLDNLPGRSAMYMINNVDWLPGYIKRRSWEPIHQYTRQPAKFPGADSCYANKVIVSSNIDAYTGIING
jgi:dTDP-4-amino-4,6-dideoxygalactose transaminase